MARIVSFVALVVVLLVIGGLFFEVMSGFLLPLFLALLLVVMFGPLHRWFGRKCGGGDLGKQALAAPCGADQQDMGESWLRTACRSIIRPTGWPRAVLLLDPGYPRH